MSKATGRPAGLFSFLAGTGLPDWSEVLALLTATRETDPLVIASWRRRWVRLDRERRVRKPQAATINGLSAGRLERLTTVLAPPSPWSSVESLPKRWLKHDREGLRVRNPRAANLTELSMDELLDQLQRQAGVSADVSASLRAALEATTPAEYTAALEQLRCAAKVSYADIAQHSHHQLSKSTAHRMATQDKLPAREDAVGAFVQACGANKVEALVWKAALARVRRGDPPLQKREEPSPDEGCVASVALLPEEELRVPSDSLDKTGRRPLWLSLMLIMSVLMIAGAVAVGGLLFHHGYPEIGAGVGTVGMILILAVPVFATIVISTLEGGST
jgi:hypothetical protein